MGNATARGIKLPVSVNRLSVYVTATGVKLGSKGRIASSLEAIAELLSVADKGTARRIRKSLRQSGLSGLAIAGTRQHINRIA